MVLAPVMLLGPAISWFPGLAGYMGTLFATFVGAGAGAALVFLAESWRITRAETHRQIRELKYAQFVLAAYRNHLQNIHDQHLSAHRDDPHRHFHVVPMGIDAPLVSLNFDALKFIIDSRDPDLLLRLHESSRSYIATLSGIEQRDQFHLRFQDEHRHGPPSIASVDPATDAILRGLTDSLYGNADAALERVKRVTVEVGEFIAEGYDTKPLRVQPTADYRPPSGKAAPEDR